MNTQARSYQNDPSVISLENGGFVATWTTGDATQDGFGAGIKAQVFDANGVKIGGEFLVNTEGYSNQYYPVIAGLANGGFVAA